MTFAEFDAAEKVRPLFWAGVAGAALSALVGLFGFHDGSLWKLPAVLEARAEAALQVAGYPGIDVQMDGQQARLYGIVASADAIPAAAQAALHAAGPGGAWSGGITSVNASGLSAGQIIHPYTWRIARQDGRVLLTGAAPSDAARTALIAAARAQFPNAEIVARLQVAGGAPSSNWTDMARHLIRTVATLDRGEARMTDTQIAVIGDGAYQAVERVRAAYAAPPPPFHAQIAVSADGLDLAFPELQGVSLINGGAEACTQAFARMTERRAVGFAPNNATIQAASLPALDALTSVALRCDRNVIEVRGPGEGGAALSRDRAAAVAAYFAGKGVSAERVRAGAGSGELSFAVSAP